MKNKQKAKFSFGAYLSFFTRFPIPWWLFLLSLLLGFANTEVVLAVSNYLIRINKGELYNGVIIGYALMNVFNALLSMLINLTGGYGSALVTLRARKLLWRKILHLPMREVERRQPSALISGLVNDITQASLVVQMAFNTIVSLYSFFRCCWEMYRFDGTLSLYMLLLLPIAVLVFALVGHLQYVAATPDFVPPAAAVPAGQNEDPNAPVWDETMDNLLACLEEKGLISGERLTLASDGLCSLAVSESGAEFYWWDLDALDKDSAEYAAYESLKTEGSIDLFNSGSLISPASNGPFALLTTGYTGDVDALTDAFMAFGQSETKAG